MPSAVGLIILSVNGQDYDCASCAPKTDTGKKIIKTMNRTLKARYKSNGIKTYSLSVSVVIPDGKDDISWDDVEDARISLESPSGNFRETYIGCEVITKSDSYSVDGETRRDLEMTAMDYLNETIS